MYHGDRDQFCEVFSMIEGEKETEEGKSHYKDIMSLLESYPHLYQGVGHLKDHLVKLYIDETVKPVVVPHRCLPYHLRD